MFLPARDVQPDLPGDYAVQQKEPSRQYKTTQEAPRSNMKTSVEPGADTRPPVVAFFTDSVHSSPPNQELTPTHILD